MKDLFSASSILKVLIVGTCVGLTRELYDTDYAILLVPLFIILAIFYHLSERLDEQKTEPSDKALGIMIEKINKDHIICEQCGNAWASENYIDGSTVCMACARKNKRNNKSG